MVSLDRRHGHKLGPAATPVVIIDTMEELHSLKRTLKASIEVVKD